MIYPFLNLFFELRVNIYKNVLTPDLFRLMETCRQIRKEGLIELKGRIHRLGVACPPNWGVLECKQAYLWCFGEPEMIFQREVRATYLSANLSSKGVMLIGEDNNMQLAIEHTFKDWSSSSHNKRMIPLGEFSEKEKERDVILFVHEDRDFLLVRGKKCRLMDLTHLSEIDLGKATSCTVDAVSNAKYLITYEFKSSRGIVRWCDLSELIKSEPRWRECLIDNPPYFLDLDVIQNQIFVLEINQGECHGQQRGVINMESGQWVPSTHRPAHQPFWDSPIYRRRRQHHASEWMPITVRHVAIGGVPCYQWDLHKYCAFPPLELRYIANKDFIPQTVRELYKSPSLTSEVVTVQSTQNGCWPVLNILYRIDQVFTCKTWRLKMPSEPFTRLECALSTHNPLPIDLQEDQWGENTVVRALRVGANWAWEPLMHILRNRHFEKLKEDEDNSDLHWLEISSTCYQILNTAALWNRPQFVEFFFFHWLPSIENEERKMSIIDDIESTSITSMNQLMDHLFKACKLGHVDVALSLIKWSALNTPMPNNQDDLMEWPPFKGALMATYGLHWSAVIPMIEAQGCSEQVRITLYRHILRPHIKFSGYRESDPEGFAKMVVDLCASEPALFSTTEAIAASAIIAKKNLLSKVTQQAEIDLPPYNGEFSEWEDIAYRESLIFHAIQSLEAFPETLEWFIDWLLNRKLHDRVEEALELMRPQWHKRQRSGSPL